MRDKGGGGGEARGACEEQIGENGKFRKHCELSAFSTASVGRSGTTSNAICASPATQTHTCN